MPRTACPACGTELDVAADAVGETVECGGCHARFAAEEEDGPDPLPDDEESWPRQRVRSANRLATLSMVLGFGSLLMAVLNVVCFAGVAAVPMAAMAIVLGGRAMKSGGVKGLAVVGIAAAGLALLVLALTVVYVGVNLALNPALNPRAAPPPPGVPTKGE